MTAHQLAATDAPIILIGMMGAGKTTIGRILAKKLNRTFIDLDQEIVARCGVDIPTIFDVEGEAGFRRREHQVLTQVLQIPLAVIATGGGVVTTPQNRSLLASCEHIIYLKATPKELLKRIGRDRNRPLLQTENPLQALETLLAQRQAFYESLARLTIPSSGQPVSTVAQHIRDLLYKEPA